MDLRSTLCLPDPDFTIPMRANLAQKEPAIQAQWDSIDVYHLIREHRRGRSTFILHDGPPYTNSPVHIGTALNKCLKDFIVKYKTLRGFDAPYVPGYDNHGLPIELAVMKNLPRAAPADQVRSACREHARTFIETQTEQFKRLGVIGDWRNRYATMDYGYEAQILRTFAKLALEGYVYRDLKPTHWSTYSRTALAETELEYNDDHVSRAIYVRFPAEAAASRAPLPDHVGTLYALIWTTTPWTIPANLAIAFHPELSYAFIEHDGDTYIVYEDLAERVVEDLEWESVRTISKHSGTSFEKWNFKHPIFDRLSLGVLANYVTTEDGTGLVHTAPGHGADDFRTGREYGLPIVCPVDDSGHFTDEAGEFSGQSIVEADETVPAALRARGNLVKEYSYRHRYPYSERDKHPVIFRSTEQWFIRLDHKNLRDRAIDAAKGVQWFPNSQSTRLEGMVRTRPDWCISRQRIWGVGIPVVYGLNSGSPLFDATIMENAARLVEDEGASAWFTAPIEDLVPEGFKHPETGETQFKRESDILDVWFDSGVTHLSVLDARYRDDWEDLRWPADLYLEGSDQHRGWFNSSLLTAIATKSEAPYRQVLTHGFVVDEKGEKMSKSKGNVVDPLEASNTYGADILRLWAATVDYTVDVPCGENLLRQVGDSYRRIRNTLRFLLANLYDFDVGEPERSEWDLNDWILGRMEALVADYCEHFDKYEFSHAIHALHSFCVKELSSFYLDAIKDSMYCDPQNSTRRESCQSTCHKLLTTMTKLIAPVLTHTAEEVYAAVPLATKLPSVLLEELDSSQRLGASESAEVAERYSKLIAFKDRLYAAIEDWKSSSGIKDTQDIAVTVHGTEDLLSVLRSFGNELSNLLRVASVELQEDYEERYGLKASDAAKCDRCRLRRADVSERDGVALCDRCSAAVSQ
jgi:isoleucyl-tRNA synthetase